jgi:hypothetical protein
VNFECTLLLSCAAFKKIEIDMKRLLGRTDIIDFPHLGLYHISAKIDTGAYTSAIHYNDIKEINGKLYCLFESTESADCLNKTIIFDEYSYTDVKSSNGYVENRYKIKTDVVFFGETYNIDLTLSTRDDMRFPVLIGRQFLKQKFLVDVDLDKQSYKQSINEHSYIISKSSAILYKTSFRGR